MERQVRLGLQELRRRRPVGPGRAGLRLARPDDLGADDSGRQDGRGRGRAWHRHPPLSHAPAGQGDLDQPDRVDLRLDRRPQVSRQVRRYARGCDVRRDPGAGLRRDGRERPDDQGSRHPRRPGAAVDDDRAVLRGDPDEPRGGDGGRFGERTLSRLMPRPMIRPGIRLSSGNRSSSLTKSGASVIGLSGLQHAADDLSCAAFCPAWMTLVGNMRRSWTR